jgi:hypothetical protein
MLVVVTAHISSDVISNRFWSCIRCFGGFFVVFLHVKGVGVRCKACYLHITTSLTTQRVSCLYFEGVGYLTDLRTCSRCFQKDTLHLYIYFINTSNKRTCLIKTSFQGTFFTNTQSDIATQPCCFALPVMSQVRGVGMARQRFMVALYMMMV